MVTYVYLNTYENGYLYVGSHTWDGPAGQLDPNYHGSSTIANNFRWIPIKEEIIETLNETTKKLHREKYWIELYAFEVGIADLVIGSPTSNKTFCSRFRPHGLLLNGHSNEPPHDHESMVKARETQRKTKGFGNMSQCHTPEARAKSFNTRLMNGSIHSSQRKAVLASSRPEVRRKIADSIDYNKVIKRAWETRNGKGVKRVVEVWKDGEFLMSGYITTCCKELGNANWHNSVARAFRSGTTEFIHHGYTFKINFI